WGNIELLQFVNFFPEHSWIDYKKARQKTWTIVKRTGTKVAEDVPSSIRSDHCMTGLSAAVKSDNGAISCEFICYVVRQCALSFVSKVGSNNSDTGSHNDSSNYPSISGNEGTISPLIDSKITFLVLPFQLLATSSGS